MANLAVKLCNFKMDVKKWQLNLESCSLRCKCFHGVGEQERYYRSQSKNKKEGEGRGRKETLADKQLDFKNFRSPANGAREWLNQSNIIDMCRS